MCEPGAGREIKSSFVPEFGGKYPRRFALFINHTNMLQNLMRGKKKPTIVNLAGLVY
jgi:hypothetical protein